LVSGGVMLISSMCSTFMICTFLAITASACQESDTSTVSAVPSAVAGVLVVRVVGFETAETVVHTQGQIEAWRWSRHGVSVAAKGQADEAEVKRWLTTVQLAVSESGLFHPAPDDPRLEEEERLEIVLMLDGVTQQSEGSERLATPMLVELLGWLRGLDTEPLAEPLTLAWLRPAAPLLGLDSGPDEAVLASHDIPHLDGGAASAEERAVLKRLATMPFRVHSFATNESSATAVLANAHVRWEGRDYALFSATYPRKDP
ncbi:MAG: hypothetical protein ACI9EF_003763, partial [Pseudohongiellaceae bacterium]